MSPTLPLGRKGRVPESRFRDYHAMACSGISLSPEVIIRQEMRHRSQEFGWKHVPSCNSIFLCLPKTDFNFALLSPTTQLLMGGERGEEGRAWHNAAVGPVWQLF